MTITRTDSHRMEAIKAQLRGANTRGNKLNLPIERIAIARS